MKKMHRVFRKPSIMHRLKATQVIAIAFLIIILLGTALLCLPVASRSGKSCGFIPALFTATSATCVTGLVVYDTWQFWSGFGQFVIIALIEIGGLGFMSAASLVIFVLRRRFGMRHRMVMAQAVGFENTGGIVRLQRLILRGSLIIEGLGALILFLRFYPEFGASRAIKLGIFHSVSAFCNAGFDILGFIPGNVSISAYATDPVVCFTLMALIVLGGLGFIVWQDVLHARSFKKLSVYSRLVLITTALLILSGMTAFCILEWDNPKTMGNMSVSEKMLAGLFQSVTTRTAGFAALDQGQLTGASKGMTIFLMLIGGSSGSTAGGIKTVTFVVIVLFIMTNSRGRRNVNIYNRTIPEHQVLNAMTVTGVMILLAIVGGIFVSATSGIGFTDSLYETVSALATVGLSTGVTADLDTAAQILLTLYMYFGRVGVLTISLGFLMGNTAMERYRYAETNLLIG